MPLLALIVTDAHNAEAIMAALPAGTVFTSLELSTAEWAKASERLASEYLLPVVARTKQEWQKAHPA